MGIKNIIGELQVNGSKVVTEDTMPSGVTSWNNLTDKPFGEIIKNDTLKVDWNTFVPEVVEANLQVYVKVSDIVPTLEDFTNGATVPGADNPIEISYDEIVTMYNQHGCFFMPYSTVVIPYDNFELYDEVEGVTLIFPEKGIYLDGYGRPPYFTINGFNGFPNTTEVKQIDRKYLPESIVVFKTLREVNKVFDGTYKFENTIIVDTFYGDTKIYYPVRYEPDNNDVYTYSTHPYYSDGKLCVHQQTYTASGINAGSSSEDTIYLATTQ